MAALPHRYPDAAGRPGRDASSRIESIVAIKAVTINESFFQGHFPGRPIMPGVLIVEALAQAAGVLAVESLGLANSGKLVYFMAIEGAKFRQPVEPGVLLKLEVEFVAEAGIGLQVRRARDDRRQARRRSAIHGDDRRPAGGLSALSDPPARTGSLDPERSGQRQPSQSFPRDRNRPSRGRGRATTRGRMRPFDSDSWSEASTTEPFAFASALRISSVLSTQ